MTILKIVFLAGVNDERCALSISDLPGCSGDIHHRWFAIRRSRRSYAGHWQGCACGYFLVRLLDIGRLLLGGGCGRIRRPARLLLDLLALLVEHADPIILDLVQDRAGQLCRGWCVVRLARSCKISFLSILGRRSWLA